MDKYDCHSHLSFLEIDVAEKIILKAPQEKKWLMGGYQPSEWKYQVALKNKFPDRILTCFGLHPWFIKSDEFSMSQDFEELKVWQDQADFIGEVGLDFFGDENDLKKDIQITTFEKQLEISSSKAFVFHIVQAHGKALEILKGHRVKGFIHSFSGSIEVAEQYASLGLLLSFGPSLLNKNFKKAREALRELPLQSILVESDSPSNSLDERNPNEMYVKVIKEVASIKKISAEELESQVFKNMEKLLSQ